MNNKNNTEKKYALITGAAKRIGASITENLHTNGFDVGIHFNSSSKDAENLCNRLNRLRKNSAKIFQGNITKSEGIDLLYKEFFKWSRKIDLLVNNASSFYPTPLGEINDENWDDLIGTNLKGPLFLCQAAHNDLKKQQGSIINLIDIYIKSPPKDHSVYIAAKAGLEIVTRSLARDLAPDVRVNGISPGAILWPEKSIDNKTKEGILNTIPLKRKGSPQDIADCVLFLVNTSNYITGQIISIDGGKSI